MSISIDDAETIESATELASLLKTTTREAVRLAVRAELDRVQNAVRPDEPVVGKKFDERLEDFYRRHPLPAPTGLPADKAFFDELSGEFD